MKNISINYPKRTILLILLLLIILSNCKTPSESVKIKKFINSVTKCAEKNDPETLLSKISPGYLDTENRSYNDISNLVHSYLGRYKGVVIHLLEVNVISVTPSRASIKAEVSFSHGAAQALRKMLRVSIRFFSFEIQLTTEADSWKISSAIWHQKESEELSPEALESLRDLFPNVF